MSTTAVPSAAVQKQLQQSKVKKGIFSVIRHLVLALLAFIWLVPIAWLLLTSFSTDKGINFTRFVPEKLYHVELRQHYDTAGLCCTVPALVHEHPGCGML